MWENYEVMTDKPAWITDFDTDSKSFEIYSDDSSLATQEFALRYVLSNGTPSNGAYDQFVVTFDYNICLEDVVNIDLNAMHTSLDCNFDESCSKTSILMSPSHVHQNCPFFLQNFSKILNISLGNLNSN